MTCPTTACFSGYETEDTVNVGGALRYFGDGHQIGKKSRTKDTGESQFLMENL